MKNIKLPDGWKYEKVGEFVSEISVRNKNNGIDRVLSVTNNKGFLQSEEYFNKQVYSKDLINYKIVKRNQVAYNPSRINVGSIDVLESFDQGVISPLYVIFQCDKRLDPKYLVHYLKSDIGKAYIKGNTSGSVRDTLKFSSLCNIRIPIPSIDIQKKIVNILDKNKIIIEKRKESIKVIDELVKSQFIEMFGDILHDDKFDKVILKEVANVGSSKRIYANEYVESGIPFYRSKEIRELGENLKPSIELFISQEKYDSVKRQFGIPKKGDILIAAIGATIGYTWIVNTDEAFYYKDGNLLNISINKFMNSIYLNHALKILINDFKYKGASGTAQLALTIEKVGKMEVTCPPIELQNQFADFVKQVDKLKFEMENSLKELEYNL